MVGLQVQVVVAEGDGQVLHQVALVHDVAARHGHLDAQQ